MLVAFEPEAFAALRKALNQASTAGDGHARLGGSLAHLVELGIPGFPFGPMD